MTRIRWAAIAVSALAGCGGGAEVQAITGLEIDVNLGGVDFSISEASMEVEGANDVEATHGLDSDTPLHFRLGTMTARRSIWVLEWSGSTPTTSSRASPTRSISWST